MKENSWRKGSASASSTFNLGRMRTSGMRATGGVPAGPLGAVGSLCTRAGAIAGYATDGGLPKEGRHDRYTFKGKSPIAVYKRVIGGCFAQVTLKVAHTPVGNLNFGQFSSTLAQGGSVSYAQEWAMGANITGPEKWNKCIASDGDYFQD
ncbi:hypothetical protein WH47_06382 [Habropoda laboriosa]|uniref:Uncharacterized protein n=1 Tax=Habropoda laboriosa TaxID=597456 RepID=A0A0L7RCV9_9HYME|nr:hypothetical protein WH47_06382 [Habropoda laboriosa]